MGDVGRNVRDDWMKGWRRSGNRKTSKNVLKPDHTHSFTHSCLCTSISEERRDVMTGDNLLSRILLILTSKTETRIRPNSIAPPLHRKKDTESEERGKHPPGRL